MSKDQDMYDDDLYGGKPNKVLYCYVYLQFICIHADGRHDADLEDLDATQLEEELVDPPDLEQSPVPAQAQLNQTQQPQNPAQTSGSFAAPPPTSVSAQLDYDANQPYGQGPGGLTGLDRIRPSDMPDEGLVDVSDSISFT